MSLSSINGALSNRGGGVDATACRASPMRSTAQAGNRSTNGSPIKWFSIGVIRMAMQIPARLADQPELTQYVWIFFLYGRSYEEIAGRLRISRASAKRRRARAEYAILGKDYPSLASRIRFKLMVKRLRMAVGGHPVRHLRLEDRYRACRAS